MPEFIQLFPLGDSAIKIQRNKHFPPFSGVRLALHRSPLQVAALWRPHLLHRWPRGLRPGAERRRRRGSGARLAGGVRGQGGGGGGAVGPI